MEPFIITIKTVHESFEMTIMAESLDAAKAKVESLFLSMATGQAIYSLRPKFIKLGDVK